VLGGGLRSIEVDENFADADGMATLSLDAYRRYGCAIMSVALVVALRLLFDPVLGDRQLFFLYFVAIVLVAGYGGYGPSLVALCLLWLSAELLVPVSGASPDLFASRSQIAVAFLCFGLPVALLGGALRAARERAATRSADLRRALVAQQAEREWLQITLSSIADAVIATDPNGLVVFLNAVAGRLTGWCLQEAAGRPLSQVFRTAQDTPLSSDDLPVGTVARDGDVIHSNDEVTLIARDGTQRCIERNAAPILDSDGRVKGVAVVFRDITERRRAKQAQQESEERFRQLADRINDVFWIHEPDGPKMVYVSPAYESIWGRTCASLYERPMSYLEAIHTDDRDRARMAHDRIVSGWATAEEYRIIHPDGTVRWIWDRGFPIKDESGRVVRLAGIAEDVTERKQAEEALRESEERFRTMADATPIMIWASGTDSLCNYFNKQWLDFTGRTIEQEMGNGWSEGVHADDRERCVDTYRTAFEACKPFLMEYRLRRHDGDYRWILDAGVPRFAGDGTFSGYIGSCLDITERKQAEEKLRDADRRKEEFLAVLSHELRNPLAPIQTALDLLEHSGTGTARSDQELATIKRQVQNLERLVDDLLDVSRISRGNVELRKEVVPLAEAIADSVEAVRALAEERHQRLHVSIPEESLFLDADRTRLEQIFSNLLIDAAKYTPRDGQIWLSAERSDNQVVIRVRDTGVGIEPEFLGKVFDLFVQGERRLTPYRNGAGIGLSLAKHLVELHGGTITAQSRGPDKGSEFIVRLPVLSAEEVARNDTPKAIELENSQKLVRRRVLIVDDNVQAADNLGRLLSDVLGQDVRVVYDGYSALDLAQSFRPNVVLLDLEMASMDGYEVAMRLRQRQESYDVPIVAVTGWAQEDYRRRSLETGFQLHLVKPVTAKQLRAVLADLELKPEDHPGILTPAPSCDPSVVQKASP
jgi:PAS domain S-box-containing protein